MTRVSYRNWYRLMQKSYITSLSYREFSLSNDLLLDLSRWSSSSLSNGSFLEVLDVGFDVFDSSLTLEKGRMG